MLHWLGVVKRQLSLKVIWSSGQELFPKGSPIHTKREGGEVLGIELLFFHIERSQLWWFTTHLSGMPSGMPPERGVLCMPNLEEGLGQTKDVLNR